MKSRPGASDVLLSLLCRWFTPEDLNIGGHDGLAGGPETFTANK